MRVTFYFYSVCLQSFFYCIEGPVAIFEGDLLLSIGNIIVDIQTYVLISPVEGCVL